VKSSVEQDPWLPFHAETFTNLALVHYKVKQLWTKKDTHNVARVRAEGDVHIITELTASINLENVQQMFTLIASDDQEKCPMSILI